MALQKSLMEQTDIVPVLKEFDFAHMDNGQLMVENPPNIKVDKTNTENPTNETNSPAFMYGDN
jgi:hypothetical protein